MGEGITLGGKEGRGKGMNDPVLRSIEADSRNQKRRVAFMVWNSIVLGKNPMMVRSERRKLARAWAKKAWNEAKNASA
jgi:hypothetical protein